ncbi:MAG: DUF2203 domain-containing protein [Dehalococcoidia bacterium]
MKQYTLEEARALLPRVIPVVEELRETFVALRALQASIAAEARASSGDGNLLANPWEGDGESRIEQLDRRMRGAAARLEAWGIEVKDAERGLIDFYSLRDGEVVYLCYLLGEADIAYFHRLADGFAGRQPL